jgi:hypothetical protein
MGARHVGALKKAVRSLQEHYRHVIDTLDHPASGADPRFPHQSCYTSVDDSTTHRFKYVRAVQEKLVFFGKTDDDEDICIKFARSYSKEAHTICATKMCAPKLKGYDHLPGDWYMIVMDDISGAYDEFNALVRSGALHEEIKEKLVALHQAGYVHGDVRDTNMMVRKDGQSGFMLIDFDWAGRIGEARYPINVNAGPDLMRPDGAYDGELIKAEHDIEMLNIMFGVHDSSSINDDL